LNTGLVLLFLVVITVCKADESTVIENTSVESNDPTFSVPDSSSLSNEGHQFQAEINQLMGLIINSLYSNRDIFMRELISNAADALSKVRFVALTDEKALSTATNLDIRVKFDRDNKLLHIRDTGIGMTKQELINNLGSIAKSGTKEFLSKVKGSGSSADFNTIGQFGVGFYSSFLVADKVTVTSKSNEDDQYIWESAASDSAAYTIAKDPRGDTLGRGTLVTLHIKDDALDYLEQEKLEGLIMKYNEFISFPIYLWRSHEEKREVEKKPEETLPETEDFEVKDTEETEKPTTTETISETVWAWDHINTNPPIWARSKSDITDDEYNTFFKDVLRDSQDPLHHSHFKAEGDVDFTALLYIPKQLPMGFWDPKFKASLRLYVKRVFITDNFDDMIPSYLAFVKGVVDSDDLPLNVSREILQQNKILTVIKKKLVRKILAIIQELFQDEKKYDDFYAVYSANIKMGVVQDTSNRARLSKLLKFPSAKSPEKMITFDQYVQNFKKGQNEIYYLGGETMESIRESPHLEIILKRGYDVLLCAEPIDEYAIQTLGKYESKYKFTDISKEGLKLSSSDEERQKELSKKFTPLTEYLAKVLDDKVNKVEVSIRLTTTPAAIVASSWAPSANMERIMKAQALKDSSAASRIGGKRVLEINPRHPLIKKLLALVEDKQTSDGTADVAYLLFDTAVLNSGYALNDPKELTSRVSRILSTTLNVDPSEQIEEYPEDVESVEETPEEPASSSDSSHETQSEEPVLEHDEL